MTIKIINRSKHPLPDYETDYSAGMDLRADLEQGISLGPLERKLISTGLFMEIPEGFEGQIRPRSGLAYKKGLSILNAPGTIDADYRGEVKVLMVNVSDETVTIEPGNRIAQLIISKFVKIHWEESGELMETSRGEGGFGHTGIK